jgi:hypothetical protein
VLASQFLPLINHITTLDFRRFLAQRIPWKSLRDLVDVVDVMDNSSQEIYRLKKKALQGESEAVQCQVAEGNDIMNILRAWCSIRSMGIISFLSGQQ